jgi:signal transduction histidine kinase
VRFGVLALSTAAGAGALAYAVAWAVLPVRDGPRRPVAADRVENLAAIAASLGALLLLRSAGVWVSDACGIIGVVAAAGIALVWGGAGGVAALRADTGATVRIAVGLLLVIVGFSAFVALTNDLQTLGRSVLGAAVATTGVLLILAPRLARLAQDLAAERRARMRSEEKAEIAAHLHDGVLQTLTLIQKRAGDNRDVATLARRQERELRAWLYEHPAVADSSLAASLRVDLAEIEDTHAVRVELVCVGDTALDDSAAALHAAVHEAVTNAARHAGADTVDVYLEVTDTKLSAFVRDRGRGFDLDAVPADRQGIVNSIRGRMLRVGGTAHVRSAAGEGTEIELGVPRRRA